ncbi:MAG: Rho termination factor N-terminal domain-containing protein [Solirubrobacterales bacterium]|nr:Rho termination factor N-terminal domain-containing protein [Solirubrobacterales bacterium]
MKKIIAISIAAGAAALVASWRRVRAENEIAVDSATGPAGSTPTAGGSGIDRIPPLDDGKPAAAAADETAAATPDGVAPVPQPPADATKSELYEIARDLEIEGRSKMTKQELLAAIRAAG